MPYKNAIALMAGTDADSRQAILSALDSAPRASSMAQLEAHLAAATEIPKEAIRATLGATASLISASEGTDAEYSRGLARGVAEAAAREKAGGLASDDAEGLGAFADFLFALMKREPVLEIAAKVASLLYDHQNVFMDSRVLTDFRPLFDDADQPTSVRAGVVIHTLRLTMISPGGEDSSLYIALDPGDLHALRGAIDRAIAKEQLLRERLAALELPLFGPSE